MKKILLFLPILLALTGAQAQQKVTLASELRELYDLSRLPRYRTNSVVSEETSYDRKGGNDDGFAGTYSFVRRNADSSLVMLDIDGPGVLHRIATPTPTTDTLDIYIDQASKPTMSVCYFDLFTGKVAPFAKPLCDSLVGGYYNYFPILFEKRLKIVSRGHQLKFHQLQYRLFPKGTSVESFHLPLSSESSAALNTLAAAWADTRLDESTTRVRASVRAGETKVIYETKKGGRIGALLIDTANTAGLRLRLTWDSEQLPAVDVPLREFFGYAFGKPAMQALLCGEKDGYYYARFPMPFDRSAKLELVNDGKAAAQVKLQVFSSDQKRNAKTEGKFYTNFVSHHLGKEDPFHVFLSIKGKGHYVGTVLKGQAAFNNMPYFFEGDDSTAVDGVFRLHGTGSEDYFNGGWYDVRGKWEKAGGWALSGCLGYGKQPAHTGGYRFYLSDKLSFEKSFYHAIEHGPEPRPSVPVDYTSVSYYYCDRDKEKQQP